MRMTVSVVMQGEILKTKLPETGDAATGTREQKTSISVRRCCGRVRQALMKIFCVAGVMNYGANYFLLQSIAIR
ncbi:hypothetical protein [Undibacterium oligocarboniphilum]|uniref:Uncharacterized protein n=1 Tax=Undibacterium oligocarboniphilum TaxID=666702 RepID=A0A850QPA0_9BURK|nr:hypothetical protein [Undibacterium oligocarboniphilum]MBC3870658.1 hypothetical protein [Undibacterium oligocarboniphilum]NVO78540.1 hypothetical protein [Undibacterium oligocarboniphilum]